MTTTGYFSGTVDFGGGQFTSAGTYDGYLASFGADGSHRWSKRFGGNDADWGVSVAVDGGGNVHITGGFLGTTDFGTGALTSAGDEDIFLLKLPPEP